MEANFTPRCQEILSLAKKLAEKFHHKEVTLDHIFLSFLKVDSFILPRIEAQLNVSFIQIEGLVADSIGYIKKYEHLDSVTFSSEVRDCLEECFKLSKEKQHAYISVEHILYVMLSNVSSSVVDYFFICDIDVAKIQLMLEEILSHDILYNPILMSPSYASGQDTMQPQSMSAAKPLESYSTNLNDLAKDGEFDFICANPTYIYLSLIHI